MSIPVILRPGTLDLDCYPPEPQTLNEAIINAAHAEMDASFSGIVMSLTAPDVDDQDKAWFNLTNGFLYFFSGGYWVRPHPILPSAIGLRILWPHTEAELWAYEGGDGSDPSTSAPTPTSGAMWEVDSTFAGKFILAPGTLSPSGDVVGIGSTGGADEIELAVENLPEHFHYISNSNASGTQLLAETHSMTVAGVESGGATDRNYTLTGLSAATNPADVGRSSLTGDGDPTPIVPPYKAIYVAKRTARRYIKA